MCLKTLSYHCYLKKIGTHRANGVSSTWYEFEMGSVRTSCFKSQSKISSRPSAWLKMTGNWSFCFWSASLILIDNIDQTIRSFSKLQTTTNSRYLTLYTSQTLLISWNSANNFLNGTHTSTVFYTMKSLRSATIDCGLLLLHAWNWKATASVFLKNFHCACAYHAWI